MTDTTNWLEVIARKERLLDKLIRERDDWRTAALEARRALDDNPCVVGEHDADRAALDAIAALLRAEEWPGASGMEDIAEVVATVRDVTTVPGAEWLRH